jgi:hypothetical protein
MAKLCSRTVDVMLNSLLLCTEWPVSTISILPLSLRHCATTSFIFGAKEETNEGQFVVVGIYL